MRAPRNWNEEQGKCLDLEIHDGTDSSGQAVMVSAWRLEEGELEKLAAGAVVYLRIYGTAHPVVGIMIGEPEMAVT